MRRIKREVNYGAYKFKETTGYNVFSHIWSAERSFADFARSSLLPLI